MSAVARWWRHPLVIDVVLFVGLGAAITTAIAVSPEGESREPDALAYGLGVAMAVLVFVRRRWPLPMLLATTVLMFAYHGFNFPGIEPAVPLSVALCTAATRLRLWWSLTVAAMFVVAQFAARRMDSLEVLADVLRDGALLVTAILLGLTIRNRAERLKAAEERRAAQERVRIARDVHDIVGHSVAAMTVQAGLAADLLDSDPAQARQALRSVRSAGREAMSELRATVGMLRTGAPAPRGLSDVDGLLDAVRAMGITVTVSRTGATDRLPAIVDTTAYRIVQEALTNVMKHASATHVDLTVHIGATALELDLTDNGASTSTTDGGFGLSGMAERAASVGGQVSAGPTESGFRVHAELPLPETT